ncbi:Lreu_0056 family protein [Companilactobacillus zhongbaensis]|uniref:Lreu_0056 family protein n=1 Tax=Companilactobacillus zhongbaensis TaxID=2486009 RepID=UPI000F77EC36|nr:DUF4767 domain-containing protein [Companilactobacillus zhongbaensis]
MKHRKLFLLTIFFTVVLVLTGCGGQNNSDSKSPQTATSKISKSKKSSDTSSKNTSEKKSSTLWNDKKDKQLESFINQWAPTMGQSYDKYDGTNPIKSTNGAVYPDDLSKENVNNSNASIGWSKNGEGNYDYNVVAIYDYDSGTTVQRITYLFAFHDGQPVALVDQSTNGPLQAAPTKNTDVASNFESIANGTYNGGSSSRSSSSSKSNSSSSEAIVHDPVIIGLLLKLRSGDDISREPLLGAGKIGDHYGVGNGSGSSTITYKLDGDNVIYYTRDYSHGDSMATAPRIPHTLSIRSLMDNYYSTPSQKQMVDDKANSIKQHSED